MNYRLVKSWHKISTLAVVCLMFTLLVKETWKCLRFYSHRGNAGMLTTGYKPNWPTVSNKSSVMPDVRKS